MRSNESRRTAVIPEQSTAFVRGAVLILAIMATAGCYSIDHAAYTDLETDQPWIGHNTRAEGVIGTFYSSMEVTRWVEWRVGNSLYDSRQITKKCERYLRSRNAWEPLGVKKYNQGTEDEGISTVLKRLMIVSLKPTVVVIGPGKTDYYEYAMGGYPGPGRSNQPVMQPDGTYRHYVGLTRGFDYGTHVPYDSAPQWFSPDLKIGPRPVEISADGLGRISVPWGELVLTREANEWVVTTAASE